MDSFLRRYLWVINLASVGLCAGFFGQALGRGAESLVPLPELPRPARAGPSGGIADRGKPVEVIVERNIFCSRCPGVGRAEPEGEPSPRRTRLALDLVVINAAVQPWSARWSSAVLRDRESRRVGGFAVGAQVKGAVITSIHRSRVELIVAGRREYLDLLDGEDLAGPEAPTPVVGGDVRKTGERSYEIRRAHLEEMLGNLNALSQGARAAPELRDGRPAGFRLLSVRRDSPFDQVGLRSGDVVSSINGLKLTSVEKALELYTKLRSASHSSLGLERAGRAITQEYTIR